MSSAAKRFLAYLDALVKTALGRTPAGRGLTVFPGDVFLVSYLRSGSTWARFLAGNLIYRDEPVTFRNLHRLVPMIYGYSDRQLRSMPRVLKSHEYFDPRYPSVIYFVRDPRDVAVSLYFYNQKVRELPDGYPIDHFVDRFIVAKTVDYADRLGSWEDHVLSWIRLRQAKSSFRLVRYEDLLSDPARELTRIAPLLGVEATSERVERAIALSSADHMRLLEQKESSEWVTTKDTRQDIPFVRDATSGGWRKYLSENAVRKIEQAWGETMRELGYELAFTASRTGQQVQPVER